MVSQNIVYATRYRNAELATSSAPLRLALELLLYVALLQNVINILQEN